MKFTNEVANRYEEERLFFSEKFSQPICSFKKLTSSHCLSAYANAIQSMRFPKWNSLMRYAYCLSAKRYAQSSELNRAYRNIPHIFFPNEFSGIYLCAQTMQL